MNKLTVLSFGGGQDSTALLYKYVYDAQFKARYAPNDFLVIMSDTGDEHPQTYDHVKEVKTFCDTHGIEFIHITPDMGYHAESWQSLRGFYNLKGGCGSKAFPKTCTDRLKITPIYKALEDYLGKKYGVKVGRKKGFYQFADHHGKIKMLIGISKGEEKRMMTGEDSTKWRRVSVDTIYPLVDLGLDRKDCQDYIASVGHPVPMPSNCILCPFASEVELLWLSKFMPNDYADWVRIESVKIAKEKSKGLPDDRNLGVWGKKLLPEVLKIAKVKHGHMSDMELNDYKMSHGHCVMSKY